MNIFCVLKNHKARGIFAVVIITLLLIISIQFCTACDTPSQMQLTSHVLWRFSSCCGKFWFREGLAHGGLICAD